MDLQQAKILRIYIGEEDHYKGKPLYEQIVLKARSLGLSGATVLQGILGFGTESHLHSSKLLDLSVDLPVVVEIVDEGSNLKKLYPFLEEAIEEGIVTVEDTLWKNYSNT